MSLKACHFSSTVPSSGWRVCKSLSASCFCMSSMQREAVLRHLAFLFGGVESQVQSGAHHFVVCPAVSRSLDTAVDDVRMSGCWNQVLAIVRPKLAQSCNSIPPCSLHAPRPCVPRISGHIWVSEPTLALKYPTRKV